MITQFILSAIVWALITIFGILPNIPQMPSFVSTSAEYVADIIIGGVSFVVYLFSFQLFLFVLLSVIVLLNFDFFYKTTLWIIRKLPISSS